MMAGGIHCHQRRQILQDEFEFLLFPPRRRSISNEFAYQRLLMIATFIRDGFIQFQNEVLHVGGLFWPPDLFQFENDFLQTFSFKASKCDTTIIIEVSLLLL